MEKYFPAPGDVSRPRAIAGVLAIADLVATAQLLANYFVSAGAGATVGYGVALALNVLHVFSWVAPLLLWGGLLSVPFATFAFATYFVALVLDLGAFFIRLFAALGSGSLFAWFTFALSTSYVAIDALEMLATGWLTWTTKRFRQRILKFVDVRMASDVRAAMLHKVSRRVYRSRLLLSLLWQVQLGLVITQAFAFALGMNLNLAYASLLLFDAPAVFSWVLVRALAGTMPIDPSDALVFRGPLLAVVATLAISAASGVVALVLRLVVLVSEFLNPTISPPVLANIRMFFGWFSFSVTTLLLIVGFLEILFAYMLLRGLDGYYARTKTWGENLANAWSVSVQEREEEEEEEEEQETAEKGAESKSKLDAGNGRKSRFSSEKVRPRNRSSTEKRTF